MTEIRQIVLAKRPEGDVTADCFRAETAASPVLADGQIWCARCSCRSIPTCGRA